MAIITLPWTIDITSTEDGLKPDLPEVANVLPGDTLIFTGAVAQVTFPPGLTEPQSGTAPGTFTVRASARDGRYRYRIDDAAQEAASVSPSVRVGVAI